MNRFIEKLPFLGAVLLIPALVVGSPDVRADDANSSAARQVAEASADDGNVNDPLEPFNRVIFEFNEVLQVLLLRPAATLYKNLVPPPAQEAVSNVLDNLNTTTVLANDLMQGEGQRAWQTTQRFFINSTYGVAGIVDRAEELGIPHHDEDFGQTLATWGVGEGFYLVLPLFGPSNPRDAVGELGVDPFLDGFNWYLMSQDYDAAKWARTALGGVEEYAGVVDELDQVKKTSVDYYAAIRSMYRQKREAEIKNGAEVDLPPIPDLSYDFEDENKGQATAP